MGRAEETWRYWSLNTRKVPASEMSDEASKRMSPVERRLTIKPNGVVLRSVKTRSDLASETMLFSGELWSSSGEMGWFCGSTRRWSWV